MIFIFICIVCFLALNLIPGDIVDEILKKGATVSQKEELRHKLGLDKPLWHQLFDYLLKIFTKFDFGKTYFNPEPILSLFFKHFKNTFILSVFGILLGILMGVFLGIISALNNGDKRDYFLNIFVLLLMVLPSFVIAFIFQYLFGIYFRFLPLTGFVNNKAKILPIITVALMSFGPIFKITRINMISALEKPYIITAYAKGLSKNMIIYKHALKNILVPIISFVALQFSSLLSGAIIVENVFDIKGIGHLMIHSFEMKENYVVLCCVILLTLCVILVNIFLEIICGILNPQLKASKL